MVELRFAGGFRVGEKKDDYEKLYKKFDKCLKLGIHEVCSRFVPRRAPVAEKDLAVEQKDLAGDTQHLGDLKNDCQQRATQFEGESRGASGELTALGKAKEFLTKTLGAHVQKRFSSSNSRAVWWGLVCLLIPAICTLQACSHDAEATQFLVVPENATAITEAEGKTAAAAARNATAAGLKEIEPNDEVPKMFQSFGKACGLCLTMAGEDITGLDDITTRFEFRLTGNRFEAITLRRCEDRCWENQLCRGFAFDTCGPCPWEYLLLHNLDDSACCHTCHEYKSPNGVKHGDGSCYINGKRFTSTCYIHHASAGDPDHE